MFLFRVSKYFLEVKKMKKMFVLLLSLLMMAGMMTLTSCRTEDLVDGERVFRFVLESDINSADPNFRTLIAEHNLYRQIYSSLFFFNRHTNEIEPRMAERFRVSDDGLVYTIYLKRGVLFHDGVEATARDVGFTVQTAAASTYIGTTVASFDRYVIIDSHTIEIHLSSPHASFFENMAQLYILPRDYYLRVGPDGFRENPIGSGPYRMVSRVPGSYILLEAFEDYHRGVAPIRHVRMVIMPDATAAAAALETGEVHLMTVASANYNQFRAMRGVNLLTAVSPHITCVHMNTEVFPFDNVLVRQAVNYAVNRQFMLDVAFDGLGVVSSNMVSPLMFGYNPNARQFTYNPARARELLAQAGITTPLHIGDIGATAFGARIAPILQENLADIGLMANIAVTDISFIAEANRGNYTIGIMGLGVYNGVAWDMDAYSILFDSAAINAFNLPRISNPRIDELFVLGRSTPDPAQRLAYYQELNNLVQEDAGWVMLYHRLGIFGHRDNINVVLHPPNIFHFNEFSWVN